MRLFVLGLMLFVSGVVQAVDQDRLEKQIREGLAVLAPDVEINRIRSTPVDGLYEVVVGTEVLYMTADGRHVLRGELIDLQEKKNVTLETRMHMRRQLLTGLPKEDMIRFSNGKVEHVIYVFTDIDCGYCRKLHQDVPYLTDHGVEVRYLAYPREGVNSETYQEMEAVWCSADRNAALTNAKSGKTIKGADCENPVAAQYKAGQAMGIRGTPAIFLESGQDLPGYVPPKELLSILNAGS